MSLFKQTTLIGIGLIGSSIARAIKENHLSEKIFVYSRTKKTIQRAKKLNLGNFYTSDLKESVKGSDLIIICSPLSTYGNILKVISNIIMPGAILTDVGSAKLNVIKAFSKLRNINFNILPAHPIAGTEKSGPDAGYSKLFNKRWCVITPMGKNDNKSLIKLKKLWNKFGSKVKIMNAEKHDKILAITSHVPHLISYSIVSSTLNANNKEKSEIIKFSAGGLRDFTRIAASNPIMWRDVFIHNKKNTSKMIEKFIENLEDLKKAIQNEDGKKLEQIFTKTKKIRKDIVKAGQDVEKPDFGRKS